MLCLVIAGAVVVAVTAIAVPFLPSLVAVFVFNVPRGTSFSSSLIVAEGRYPRSGLDTIFFNSLNMFTMARSKSSSSPVPEKSPLFSDMTIQDALIEIDDYLLTINSLRDVYLRMRSELSRIGEDGVTSVTSSVHFKDQVVLYRSAHILTKL